MILSGDTQIANHFNSTLEMGVNEIFILKHSRSSFK